MSSTSSDEFDAEQLKEAIATDLISDDIYKGNKKKVEEKPKLKSLRPTQADEENQFNGPEVTKEFRNHVAKHLVRILDDSIKEITNDTQPKKLKYKGGVRLFSDSSHILKKLKTEEKQMTNCRKKQNIDSDSEENETKVKSVAVDFEDILSKKEITQWSKRSKAPVFKYKSSKKGQLYLLGEENTKHII